MQAIKAGNYVKWPIPTPKIVRKHFPESDEVQKGYIKQKHQNVQSTKIKVEPDDEPIPDLGTHVNKQRRQLRHNQEESNKETKTNRSFHMHHQRRQHHVHRPTLMLHSNIKQQARETNT
jgi:hypothetical protein